MSRISSGGVGISDRLKNITNVVAAASPINSTTSTSSNSSTAEWHHNNTSKSNTISNLNKNIQQKGAKRRLKQQTNEEQGLIVQNEEQKNEKLNETEPKKEAKIEKTGYNLVSEKEFFEKEILGDDEEDEVVVDKTTVKHKQLQKPEIKFEEELIIQSPEKRLRIASESSNEEGEII